MNAARTTIVDHLVNVALSILAVAIVLVLMAYAEGEFVSEADAAKRTADTSNDRAAEYAAMHANARHQVVAIPYSTLAESQP